MEIKAECKYLTQNQCFKALVPDNIRTLASTAKSKEKKESAYLITKDVNMTFLYSRTTMEDKADR